MALHLPTGSVVTLDIRLYSTQEDITGSPGKQNEYSHTLICKLNVMSFFPPRRIVTKQL